MDHNITESHDCRDWNGHLEILESSPPSEQAPYSRLHRWVSRWVLNISREGESITSLGSLFQCSITLTVKKFLCILVQNFLCTTADSPCPVPTDCWKEAGHVLLTPTLKIFININQITSESSFLKAEQTQVAQPFLTGGMLQTVFSFWWFTPIWDPRALQKSFSHAFYKLKKIIYIPKDEEFQRL